MTNVKIMAFIIGFWLVFPLPLMFMGLGGFEQLNFEDLQTVISDKEEQPGVLESLGYALKISMVIFWIYVQILIIGIGGAPLIVNLFVLFLKIISGFILLLVARGN